MDLEEAIKHFQTVTLWSTKLEGKSPTVIEIYCEELIESVCVGNQGKDTKNNKGNWGRTFVKRRRKMIIKIIGLLMVMSMFLFSLAYAAPVGNPAKPILEQYNETPLKIGAEADIVIKRDLKAPDEDIELNTNWYTAKLSYTFLDKIDLYTLLGTVDGKVKEIDGNNDLEYLPDTGFAWGLGTTVLLYENEKGLRVGLDTKYRYSSPELQEIILNGTNYSVSNGKANFKEWQIACAVSLDLSKYTSQSESPRCIPYIGMKYSDVRTSAKGTISGTEYNTERASSKKKIGPFVGADFYLGTTETGSEFGINLEGRFIDEQAVTIGLNYKF